MPTPNYMHVFGISHKNPSNQLFVPLAPDTGQVNGFGQPVTTVIARKMIDDYAKQFTQAADLADIIAQDPTYAQHPNLPALRKLTDKSKQVVSGVFGKEIILQIIAQQGCEGIRYIVGLDPKEQTTIILIGVKPSRDAAGNEITKSRTLSDGSQVNVPQSEPLRMGSIAGLTDEEDGSICGEVHDNSMNLEEAQRLLDQKKAEKVFAVPPTFGDVVLGSY